MEPGRWPTWRRDAATLAGVAVLGLLGMRGGRVPLLGAVDLGFHELGHLVCYLLPVGELVTAAAGSVVQVGVPLGLAAVFLVRQRDRAGGAVCLAWAATAALDASRYVADAPYERLPLIGGDHDWAFFFSAEGIDAVHLAPRVAGAVAVGAWAAFAAAVVVALWPLFVRVGRPARPPAVPRSGAGAPRRPRV